MEYMAIYHTKVFDDIKKIEQGKKWEKKRTLEAERTIQRKQAQKQA